MLQMQQHNNLANYYVISTRSKHIRYASVLCNIEVENRTDSRYVITLPSFLIIHQVLCNNTYNATLGINPVYVCTSERMYKLYYSSQAFGVTAYLNITCY
jgi:hypothetical protein